MATPCRFDSGPGHQLDRLVAIFLLSNQGPPVSVAWNIRYYCQKVATPLCFQCLVKLLGIEEMAANDCSLTQAVMLEEEDDDFEEALREIHVE